LENKGEQIMKMNKKVTQIANSNGWDLDLLESHGGYTTYYPKGMFTNPREFICRFKYTIKDRPGFLRFLVCNFTPEEYLNLLKQKDEHGMFLSPAGILRSKGYVSKMRGELLENNGYEPTPHNASLLEKGELTIDFSLAGRGI